MVNSCWLTLVFFILHRSHAFQTRLCLPSMTISLVSCESEALFLFVPRLLVLLDFVVLLLLSTGLHSSVGGVGNPLDILLAAMCYKFMIRWTQRGLENVIASIQMSPDIKYHEISELVAASEAYYSERGRDYSKSEVLSMIGPHHFFALSVRWSQSWGFLCKIGMTRRGDCRGGVGEDHENKCCRQNRLCILYDLWVQNARLSYKAD